MVETFKKIWSKKEIIITVAVSLLIVSIIKYDVLSIINIKANSKIRSEDKSNIEYLIRNSKMLINNLDISLTKEEKRIVDKEKEFVIDILRSEYYYDTYQGEEVGINKFIIDVLQEKTNLNIKVNIIDSMNDINKESDLILVDASLQSGDKTSKDLLNSYKQTSPYFREKLYFYSNDHGSKVDIESLNNKKVGVLSQYYNQVLASSFFAENKSLQENILIKYNDKYMIERALYRGDIDYFLYFLNTEKIKKGFNISQIDQLFKGIEVSAYHNNRNQEVIDIINRIFVNDNFQVALNKYRGLEVELKVYSGNYYTKEEKEFIEKTKQEPLIVINYDYDSPAQMYDKTSIEWLGAQPHIWDKIEEISGLQLEYDNSYMNDLEGIRDVLRNKETTEVSMLLSKNKISETDDILFLKTGLKAKVSLYGINNDIKKYDANSIYNYKVAALKDREATDIIKNNFFALEIDDSYEDLTSLTRDLKAKKVDLIILHEYQFNELYYNDKNYFLAEKYKTPFTLLFSTAMTKNDEGKLLKGILEKSLLRIDEDEVYRTYYQDYVNIEIISKNLVYTSVIVFLMLSVLLLSFIYIYKSKLNLKAALSKLERALYYDKITNVKNRVSLYSGEELINTAIVLNIINFSRFNNQYGILVGDKVLKEVADRLVIATKKNKEVDIYRIENDEFGLITHSIKSESWCISMIEKILKHFEKPFIINGEEDEVHIVIGCSIGGEEEKTEAVVNKAQIVTSIVKGRKKENYGIATEEKFKKYFKNRFLRQELGKGFEQKSVVPFYQPKYNIFTNDMIGVETLARMNHKELGLIFPDEFVPILEEINKIDLLDIYMLFQASRDLVQWKKQGLIKKGFRMSFNFSILSIEKNDIVEIIKKVKRDTGVEYDDLELEVTETAVTDNMANIIKKLEDISKMGVKISLDDFSAGNSNFTRLAELPIDTIKLDKGLLDAGLNDVTLELITSIRDFAKRVGLDIIVEGVEEKEQVDFLKGIGIPHAQGYFYSRPIKNHEFIKLL